MNYSAIIRDTNGEERTVQITKDDSVEALKNDYKEIVRKYDPRRVSICRVQTNPGEALHLKVTVLAPSHYLISQDDTEPKRCSSMTADIVCYPGYPLKRVDAFYASDHYLASPNVFKSGVACIDNWIPLKSSLITVTEKLVRDMIHDPLVTRYDSLANHSVVQWHKDGVEAGRFPTVAIKDLYAPRIPSLPPRYNANKSSAHIPALPRRLKRNTG